MQVDECQSSLDHKKEELDKLNEKERNLASMFTHTLGENNKFEAFLIKVYKKKVKRVKKIAENEGLSDEESEEEDSDDDYDSDEDDSDADELDDSVCPPGCDQVSLIELQLRNFYLIDCLKGLYLFFLLFLLFSDIIVLSLLNRTPVCHTTKFARQQCAFC